MKKNIVDTAAQLIAKHGLKKFTIDEIASELKMSKKTIYQHFHSKNEIIHAYFATYIESDKQSTEETLSTNHSIPQKIHDIVYASHQYRLPIAVLEEARHFYPEEWASIEELRQFKLDVTQTLLERGIDEGIFKPDINLALLSKLIEKTSTMFMDYEFLLENRLKPREAIDEALNMIFDGVIRNEHR
ncbi:TetR/AcrR family transcriptional regulator [Sporolactobacillus shoreicorticis]|uniref:TetR/AcrR family transcriptional regulator n=1 Tax=Sporolactobacillus shoreicorticis TaxID=1923877 RepID=A0ABW5S2A7_9BACL|nr:TetR/AcrR family transcriptional regulator [Sporolactobacillus shoreicorticis]MCO7125332.1 TetR/AcrR family transcriptional regulator [Sporolactobacillus shoreicorticis]